MFAINTGKNVHNAIPPSRYELDGKFKLVQDLSNKIATQYRQCQTFSELFTTTYLGLRQQLCEEIKVLFRYAPVEYGKTCVETLWTRNYYDYVKFFKKSRKNLREHELILFRIHLTSGIGYYHSLILSFRKVFRLSILDNLISYCPKSSSQALRLLNVFSLNVATSRGDDLEESEDLDDNDEEYVNAEFDIDYIQDENFKKTLHYLTHRFYICVGDLARYYVDYFSLEDDSKPPSRKNRSSHPLFNIAAFYYSSACLIEPNLGMPFNQLGTLYSGQFFGIDSLYYYFRCLNSKNSFDGVIGNLRTTFEFSLNQKSKSSVKKSGSVSDEQDDGMKRFVLELIGVFSAIFNVVITLNNQGAVINAESLIDHSNKTLDYLACVVNLEDELGSATTTVQLTTDNLFKIFSIFILLIERIQLAFEKSSIRVNLDSKLLKCNNPLSEIDVKANFIFLQTLNFLFRFITLILKREIVVLRQDLKGCCTKGQTATSLMDTFEQSSPNKAGKCNWKPPKGLKVMRSISSDFADQGDDSVMMDQLKSTAINSIANLLDYSSDTEDIGENGKEVSDDEDLYGNYFENGLELCDENDNRKCLPNNRKATEKLIDIPSIDSDYPDQPASQSMDQLLTFVYTNTNAPLIKFFIDYFQSIAIFKQNIHQFVQAEFFQVFLDYLNILSEFDLNVLSHSRGHLSSSALPKDRKTSSINLNNFVRKYSSDLKLAEKYPLTTDVENMNITEGLSQYYRKLFHLPDDNEKCQQQILSKLSLTNDQYGFVCIRCILLFGVEMVSFGKQQQSEFKLSLDNFDPFTLHNLTSRRPLKYRFVKSQPPTLNGNNSGRLLISFNETEDNLPAEDSRVNNNNNTSRGNKLKTATASVDKKCTSSKPLSKSLSAMEKLPYVLIDPYVYLEYLPLIRDLVWQKKAFIIVPKLVTDFLNNLKEINYPNSSEASDFLSEEVFRGSRMIRFIRNDDRLELETLQYPNCVWRRTIDQVNGNGLEEFNDADEGKTEENVKQQDMALFYELLEHCHYLLVNKVLVNTHNSRSNGIEDEPEPIPRIVLITNSLTKWTPTVVSIAQTYGIEIKTMQTFLTEESNRKQFKVNKPKKNKAKPTVQHTPPPPMLPQRFNTIQSYGRIPPSRPVI